MGSRDKFYQGCAGQCDPYVAEPVPGFCRLYPDANGESHEKMTPFPQEGESAPGTVSKQSLMRIGRVIIVDGRRRASDLQPTQ